MDLQPGMRILDLGSGLAASSIFLHREFGVQVWATDLWFSASENLRRIRDAGVGDQVFPIHADARSLPFAEEFFDAIVSIDSFVYYGTDDLYLNYLARFVKPTGQIGIAGAGLMREIGEAIPDHLREWWTPDVWCLHSADWWRRHWERTGIISLEVADAMPEGWQRWLDWQRAVAPDNDAEIRALEADRGSFIGYVRVVGRRRPQTTLPDPIVSVPTEYKRAPLLRDEV
jgi:cyclopropane fatty-acyl-phospholipid synthase-like methyltransferase